MFPLAKYYFIIYGLVTILGGTMGYVKKGSVASIISGGICGVLLLAGAFLLHSHPRIGLGIALVVSLALAGRFVPAVLRGAFNPGAYIVPLAIAGMIISLVCLFSAK